MERRGEERRRKERKGVEEEEEEEDGSKASGSELYSWRLSPAAVVTHNNNF